ncbi:GNAT family N-acetyltransferase [Paenibacillus sp. JX-17]|uniref:GNAT family N-acetyltransferase n=1 Tax=Paenibacillus lacisoli TaxID=3064525 RepID=A0ABT9CFQ7_9BACL|nr:GNAT family N-acetyltransferase [Paenibacillus sp. JX-17]MDO7906777.1 GNAT family N-acetyltransferase [Paenibacillus sp. JX-17]
MLNVRELLMLDISYLGAFSKRKDTSWGPFFYNENQPGYYDSNHAHIVDECRNPQLMPDEIIQFYQAKKIVPRLYIYNVEVQQKLIHELKIRGFGYEELDSPIQLWNNQVIEIRNNKHVVIEVVTDENYQEALDVEGSIKEFGGKESIEKVYREQFNHPFFTHYLLRYDGVPCSTACIFEDEKHIRMESVATVEEYRGKGLIGELIHYIQKEVENRGVKQLWVYPINDWVGKLYEKYGFQTVINLTMGHAFLSGKRINEIRN